jgi:hypothetical protein
MVGVRYGSVFEIRKHSLMCVDGKLDAGFTFDTPTLDEEPMGV